MDLLPTLAQLAGTQLPPELVLDGGSIADILLDNNSNSTADRSIFFYRGNLLYAVRNSVAKA
jgi:arylsulfatase A-like enzyme